MLWQQNVGSPSLCPTCVVMAGSTSALEVLSGGPYLSYSKAELCDMQVPSFTSYSLWAQPAAWHTSCWQFLPLASFFLSKFWQASSRGALIFIQLGILRLISAWSVCQPSTSRLCYVKLFWGKQFAYAHLDFTEKFPEDFTCFKLVQARVWVRLWQLAGLCLNTWAGGGKTFFLCC